VFPYCGRLPGSTIIIGNEPSLTRFGSADQAILKEILEKFRAAAKKACISAPHCCK
jgi:hypothetical protein